MKEYKLKIKYDFAEALEIIISKAIESIVVADDEDRLYIAALGEVLTKIYRKKENYQKEYSMKCTPVQAFALRLLYNDFGTLLSTPYTENHLRRIANEIHQHYS